MLIKQAADNSNYLSVALAPLLGHSAREGSAASRACTSRRLILFLIRAHPEQCNKCSIPHRAVLYAPPLPLHLPATTVLA